MSRTVSTGNSSGWRRFARRRDSTWLFFDGHMILSVPREAVDSGVKPTRAGPIPLRRDGAGQQSFQGEQVIRAAHDDQVSPTLGRPCRPAG